MANGYMQGIGLRKLANNATSTFGRQVGSGLLQLVTIAIIARVYGPEGNGAYNIALLLPSVLATFLNLGIGPANVYFISSGKVSAATVWAFTFKLFLFLSVIGIAVGAFILLQFSEQWFPGVSPELLWLALSIYPLSLLLSFISSIFQGLQQFKAFNIILLAQPAITLIFVVFLATMGGGGITWVLFAHLAGLLITLLAGLYLLRACLLQENNENNENYSACVFNYGYKAHLGNILAFINYKIDIFLVNFFLSPASAGIYVISVQLCERLWLFSQSISTVLLPRLSELSNDEATRQELTPLITRLTLFATFIAGAVLGAVGLPLISLVFGPQYLDAYILLLILLPGIILFSASRILSNDLAAQGKPELNMYTAFVVAICNIIGNILLIPSYGLVGAALATTFSYIIHLLMTIVIYCNITKVSVLKILLIKSDDLSKLFVFALLLFKRLMPAKH